MDSNVSRQSRRLCRNAGNLAYLASVGSPGPTTHSLFLIAPSSPRNGPSLNTNLHHTEQTKGRRPKASGQWKPIWERKPLLRLFCVPIWRGWPLQVSMLLAFLVHDNRWSRLPCQTAVLGSANVVGGPKGLPRDLSIPTVDNLISLFHLPTPCPYSSCPGLLAAKKAADEMTGRQEPRHRISGSAVGAATAAACLDRAKNRWACGRQHAPARGESCIA